MRKTLTLLAAVSLLALPAAAQHIIGTNLGATIQLVDVNPVTGVCALIGAPTDSTTIFGSGTAYDATNNLYYFLGGTGGPARLYQVNTGTGAFSSVAISGVTQPNVRDLEYNSSNATLYALISVGSALQLAIVSTVSGVITPVGSPFSGGAALPFSGDSKLDASGGHWFFRGSPNTYGVDMITLDIYRTAAEPGPNPLVGMAAGGGNWYFLQFNGADGRLIRLDTTNTASFGTVALTGANLTGGSLGVTGGTIALDTAGSRFFFKGTVNGGASSLLAVNTASGTFAMAAGYPVALSGAGTNYQNAEYDPGTLPVKIQTFRAE